MKINKKILTILILICIILIGAYLFTSLSTGTAEYTSNTANENALVLENSKNLSLENARIYKTGDVSRENEETSDFYGTNAAVLVLSNTLLELKNSHIITNATGANAIFTTNGKETGNNNMPGSQNQVTETGAIAKITNTIIDTYKDKSRGLDATYGGEIIGEDLTINTRGGSCAALATDRGEGTVIVSNTILNTGVDNPKSSGSPLIYSTGTISLKDSEGTAYQGQIGCIEGKNSINIENSQLTGYGKGNRESNGEYVDLGGFFIYQSMSGDADIGTATLNITDSKLTIAEESEYSNNTPIFHITNTKANINIKDTELNFNSKILLEANGQDQWGQNGANGGEVNFKSTDETLEGNILIDEISTLNLNLISTSLTGAINPTNQNGQINITINEDSTWTLTEDSYISSLTNNGHINYNGHKLYINGQEYTG